MQIDPDLKRVNDYAGTAADELAVKSTSALVLGGNISMTPAVAKDTVRLLRAYAEITAAMDIRLQRAEARAERAEALVIAANDLLVRIDGLTFFGLLAYWIRRARACRI